MQKKTAWWSIGLLLSVVIIGGALRIWQGHHLSYLNEKKTEFLKALEQYDLTGASVVLKMLQAELPADDPFMAVTGPEALRETYQKVVEKVAPENPAAGFLLMTRLHALLPHDPSIGQLKENHQAQLIELMQNQKNPALFLSMGFTQCLPGMTAEKGKCRWDGAQKGAEAADWVGRFVMSELMYWERLPDVCLRQWVQGGEGTVHCQDRLSSSGFYGPHLVVIPSEKRMAVMPQLLTVMDYNIYCADTKSCELVMSESLVKSAFSQIASSEMGGDLSEVERAIHSYNNYCLTSNQCQDLIMQDVDLVHGLSESEVNQYANWLSKKTGFHYRPLTEEEWLVMATAGGAATCASESHPWGIQTAPEWDEWLSDNETGKLTPATVKVQQLCKKTTGTGDSKLSAETSLRRGVRLMRELSNLAPRDGLVIRIHQTAPNTVI